MGICRVLSGYNTGILKNRGEIMGLMEDIEEIIEKKKDTKKEKIVNVKSEIEIMIKEKIPLKKQIELLIKNNVVESIDLKYYREILKAEFGCMISKNNVKKIKKLEVKKVESKKIKPQGTTTPKEITRETITEMLSKDIEIKF